MFHIDFREKQIKTIVWYDKKKCGIQKEDKMKNQ